MERKLGRMGRKPDLGIFKLLIRMGRTLLRKVPIGRRSHRGKEKKVSSSGFPKFRNRGITRSMPPINLFRTAQSRHCIPSIMPEGKPQSPSIKQWGGGTWIYLGNFKFTAHEQAHERIVLTNQSNKSGKIITADAIKIGGGMGNIARSPLESPYPIEAETSGYPRFTEAARYWLQWAGIPDSIYSKSAFRNDYQDDIYARPQWVNYLKEQTHIPIDMAFAFHSDAGTTPDDSIIGTLGIYMSKSNDGIYTNRKSREIARDLTDMIQTQILSDVRKVYNPQWSRRGMWNQSYIEARIP